MTVIRRRTLCAGQTVEGKPCRQVRLDVEPPWFCHAHRSQDGLKRIVSAEWPRWLYGDARPERLDNEEYEPDLDDIESALADADRGLDWWWK